MKKKHLFSIILPVLLILCYSVAFAQVAAPSNLSATAVSSNQINLSWTDNSTKSTQGVGFKIERGSSSSGPWAEISTVAANATSYSNTGLSASTTYYYRIRAYNVPNGKNKPTEYSAYSNTASATTQSGTAIPNAPSSLSAAAVSSSQINLSWADNSSNETGFKIERATSSGGPWSQIATVGVNVKTYSNTGLTASTTYYYHVHAYNTAGDSAACNTASATTQSGTSDPYAPSNLTATAISTSQINLNWIDNSSNENGFAIERALSSVGPWSNIATLGTNMTSYSNTGLSPSTTYYYRVSAYTQTKIRGKWVTEYSAYSNTASATTTGSAPGDTTPPTVSITSPASGTTYTTAQTVTITASASDNVGVTRVEFYDASTLKGTDTTNTYTYSWTFSAANNGTHNWIAKAYDAAGNVRSSSTVSLNVNIGTADTTPPSVSITSPASGTTYTTAQTVTITASASDNVGVTRVEFYDASTLKGTDTTNTYTYNWTFTASDNGTHNWIAKAYDAAGNVRSSSAVSLNVNVTTDTTPPATPSGLTATAVSSSQINLSWSPSFDTGGSGLAGYKVYRSTTQIATTTATNYSDNGRAANTRYCYKVAAYDNAGNTSAQSTQACATTQADPVAGWNLVPTDGVMNSFTTLYSVWASDPSNVWAVGYNSGWGTIFKWDGTSWSVAWSGSSTIPRAIWGSSASDVWAVGSHGVILHWNGTSWSLVSNPAGDNNINAVWGTGPGNVWAVGPVDTATNYSFALHWNGQSWSVVSTGSTLRLTGIWGSGTNDIWAVGLNGGILHWNGTSWSTSVYGMVSLPNLWGIWGSAANDVWAVGGSPTLGNKLMHWNGSSWSTITPVTTSCLYGVWGTAGNDVWVVGAAGTILNWNGAVWSQTNSSTAYDLNSVHGTISDAWTVGTGGTVLQNQEP
jgi:hypothetical protein